MNREDSDGQRPRICRDHEACHREGSVRRLPATALCPARKHNVVLRGCRKTLNSNLLRFHGPQRTQWPMRKSWLHSRSVTRASKLFPSPGANVRKPPSTSARRSDFASDRLIRVVNRRSVHAVGSGSRNICQVPERRRQGPRDRVGTSASGHRVSQLHRVALPMHLVMKISTAP